MAWTNVVRGTPRVRVEALDGMQARRTEAGTRLAALSVPFSALREQLGGDEGEIVDGFGDAHSLSLAAWANRDPGTRLVVSFSYQEADLPHGFRGTIYPADVLARARPR